MALAAWALGAALLLARAARAAGCRRDRRAPAIASARAAGTASRCGRSTRSRTGSTTPRSATCATASPRCSCPTGVLVALGVRVHADARLATTSGRSRSSDLPIVVLLVLACAAAFTAARDRGRLRPVLALSVLGFALAAVYAVVGAPDVALVAVLVETVFTLVFVGVFSRLPPRPAPARAPRARGLRRRNVAGRGRRGRRAFATIWAALSRTSPAPATRPSRSRGRPTRTAATSSR